MNHRNSAWCLVLLCLILILTGCGGTGKAETTEAPTIPADYEYDALQKIYLAITPETTSEAVEELIGEYGLCFTRKEYGGRSETGSISYKIAYTDGAAKQRHADPGDYLDISIGRKTGTLCHAQYVTSGVGGSALLYCYGNWFHFSVQNAQDYSGYYYISHSSKDQGINIRYTNGNERDTNYILYSGAEALLERMICEKLAE